MDTENNNTSHTLSIFAFDSAALRIFWRSGEPWFVAKDICRILGIENHRDAVERLDADEKDGVGLTDAIGREQETAIISESGMYCIFMRCRNATKPGHPAHTFRKWVTAELLPTLRKNGTYTTPAPATPPVPAVDRRKSEAALSRRTLAALDTLTDLSLMVSRQLKELAAARPTTPPPAAPARTDLTHLGQNSRLQAIIHHIRTHYNRGAASPHLAAIARNCRCTRADAQTAIALFDLENAGMVQ
ncbi:BRO N-terminal domain containing protein [uncultured Caudovirales phage]|uniref:BRO N-terminal domain containing protein n=1 Tax=uncultured Caudovirales phage TaxID=2100421 RepID=A0A6J5NAG1_9CAUD|nr:BRO N-terminal domain containing protein [uncultured Caudovirales phage]